MRKTSIQRIIVMLLLTPAWATVTYGEPGSGATVLDDLEVRAGRAGVIQPPRDIELSIGLPAQRMGPVHCDIEYECPITSYQLQLVKDNARTSVMSRLERLKAAPLFNCSNIINDYENKQSQIRCSYVRSIHFLEGQPPAQTVALPFGWTRLITGEKPLDVWLEAGARLTETGLPMEKGTYTRPVALLTDKHLYLAVEESLPAPEYAQQFVVKGKRLFSLSGCPSLRSCTTKVMAMFLEELETRMAAAPLLASRVLDSPQKDGEWVAKRDRQKSLVLGRNGWLPEFLNSAYELSVYTLKWTSTDSAVLEAAPDHTLRGKGAVGSVGRYVFVDLEQLFLISADGFTYKEEIEPKSQMESYLSLYQRAVEAAFKGAIKATCNQRLKGKGMLADYTCDVRGEIP